MSTESDLPVTATFVRRIHGWRGDARLYRLSRSVRDAHESHGVTHVIVSAVDVMFSGPETYIFPANAAGEDLNMLEMLGSFRGDLDHERALRGAGWEVEHGV